MDLLKYLAAGVAVAAIGVIIVSLIESSVRDDQREEKRRDIERRS